MKQSYRSIAYTLGFAVLVLSGLDAQVCPRLESLSLNEQLQVLSDTDRTDRECTAYLIKHLGEEHYVRAARVIVNYLDFEWRKSPVTPAIERLPGTGFPAIEALFEIGQSAVTAITDFLASEQPTELARKNASVALLFIYREHQSESVRVLIRESRATGDVLAASRLRTAAIETARHCVLEQAACRGALLSGDTR